MDAAQGLFNTEKLTELLSFPGMALDGTGFESVDHIRILGTDPIQVAAIEAAADAVNELDAPPSNVSSETFRKAS